MQTQGEAQSIHDAIASGASTFAAEAEQNSIDTTSAANGGQIPCIASNQIVNQVITSAINGLSAGQLSTPVYEPNSQVWFVLELDGRQAIPFATAEPQIRQQLLAVVSGSVSSEFSRLAKKAKVTVDPRFGTWSPAAGIEPPSPPPAKDLLSSSADQSGSSSTSAGG